MLPGGRLRRQPSVRLALAVDRGRPDRGFILDAGPIVGIVFGRAADPDKARAALAAERRGKGDGGLQPS